MVLFSPMRFVRAYCFTYYPCFVDAYTKKLTLNRLARSHPSGHFYSVTLHIEEIHIFLNPLISQEWCFIQKVCCNNMTLLKGIKHF